MSNSFDYFAVVTGGGNGIGRELCRQLAKMGATVAVVDKDLDSAQATCTSLQGEQHLAFAGDVARIEDWDRLREELQENWPRLDLLVNNAGVLMGGPLADCPADQTARLIEVNLLGTLYGCQTLLPWLTASRTLNNVYDQLLMSFPATSLPKPGIINTGSIFAVLSPPGFGAYSAAKAGVVSLSESLRGEVAPLGLNVTVTLPGVTRTSLFDQGKFAAGEFRKATLESVNQAGMTPEHVARETLNAARAGKLYAPIGRRATWYWRLKHWAPRQTIAAVAKQARKKLGLSTPPS